ncbi:S24 family peptidase [Vreelandella neptunia]|uniref:LexA family protein n=1 Tax=Vreelandella neptunia TaxID=115551 RepID=UPI003159D297
MAMGGIGIASGLSGLVKEALKPYSFGSSVAPPPKLDGYVPIINWVQAGAWTEVCEVEFEPEEFAPRPPNSSVNTFALRVRGQSMLPKYEPDLIIYVDPEVVPFDGDDVIALLTEHNEATFKQLVEEPGGGRLLKARNPSWPEPWIHINGNCEIIGVVVGALWLRKPRA